MNLGLADRVALVTGGSSGIGQAIARALAAEGARVVFCSRDAARLAAAERAIREAGGDGAGVVADVTRASSADEVIERTLRRYGRLDVLVNNVGGIDHFAGIFDLADDEWRSAFELNLMPVVRFSRAAVPVLRRSPAGRIVNVSSVSAMQPGRCNPHYTAMKAAVVNVSRYLANVLAPDRILVNAVCPGPVRTDAWNVRAREMAAADGISVERALGRMEEEEARKIPLGRSGEGDDVGGLVAFLASDRAGWITGSCFTVDGGKFRSIY